MDFWNIVAIGLTFIGTSLSFWQAYKAKTYKEEIKSDRLKIVLIELASSANRAREECRKIVTPANKPMRGVDSQTVINSIQDFLDKVQDNAHKFKIGEFETKTQLLQSKIHGYKTEEDSLIKCQIGDDIYRAIGDMTSMIKRTLDSSV